jgi:esterase/lipase superfamily enzyme
MSSRPFALHDAGGRRARFMRSLRRLAWLALAALPAVASAAKFDLCVRGTGIGVNRTARLTLDVTGADISAVAPRVAAALANQRFWNNEAEEVFGAPFDPEICGQAVAPALRLEVSLTEEEARALLAATTRGSGSAAYDAARNAVDPAAPAGSNRSQSASRGMKPTSPGVASPGGGAGLPPDDDLVRDAQGNVQYQVVRVHYATNRQETSPFAPPDTRFGGERGPLSFGLAHVTVPKTHRVGALEAPSILRLEFRQDPNKHVILASVQPLAQEAWRAEIAKRATALGNAGILVFIHGYNVLFADAARRAGQLSHDLGFAGPTVLFSWPSRGGLVDYTVDEQAAEWSVPDMKEVLASVATIAPGVPVYVIAHSMGNRVLTRGFKALLEEDPNKRRAFRQIVLAAPDIDADVFRREIGPAILGKGPRVTLYASSNDKALVASRKVHGNYKRLGESGDSIVVMRDLDTVDASNVSTEFLGHSYFGDSTTVMSDLIYVIQKSLPPQERVRFALESVRTGIGQYWRFKGQ